MSDAEFDVLWNGPLFLYVRNLARRMNSYWTKKLGSTVERNDLEREAWCSIYTMEGGKPNQEYEKAAERAMWRTIQEQYRKTRYDRPLHRDDSTENIATK